MIAAASLARSLTFCSTVLAERCAEDEVVFQQHQLEQLCAKPARCERTDEDVRIKEGLYSNMATAGVRQGIPRRYQRQSRYNRSRGLESRRTLQHRSDETHTNEYRIYPPLMRSHALLPRRVPLRVHEGSYMYRTARILVEAHERGRTKAMPRRSTRS
jgi:hypothetical protein